MALLFADGLDDAVSDTVLTGHRPYLSLDSGAGNWEIVATGGWGGGQHLAGGVDDLDLTWDTSGSSDGTLIMQFAFKITYGTPDQEVDNFIIFRNASNGIMTRLYILSNGTMVVRGQGTDLIGMAAGRIKDSHWHYIQIKHVTHASAGAITMRIDGVEVFDITGIDTTASSETSVDHVEMRGTNANGSLSCKIDDIVFMDGSGGVMDDFVDALYIESLAPASDGTNTDWTINGAEASRWETILQGGLATAITATNFLEDAVSNERNDVNVDWGSQDYTVGTIPFVNHRSLLDQATSGDATQFIERASSEVQTGSITLNSTLTLYDQIAYVDPNGGGAWSVTNVADVEIGVDVV